MFAVRRDGIQRQRGTATDHDAAASRARVHGNHRQETIDAEPLRFRVTVAHAASAPWRTHPFDLDGRIAWQQIAYTSCKRSWRHRSDEDARRLRPRFDETAKAHGEIRLRPVQRGDLYGQVLVHARQLGARVAQVEQPCFPGARTHPARTVTSALSIVRIPSSVRTRSAPRASTPAAVPPNVACAPSRRILRPTSASRSAQACVKAAKPDTSNASSVSTSRAIRAAANALRDGGVPPSRLVRSVHGRSSAMRVASDKRTLMPMPTIA